MKCSRGNPNQVAPDPVPVPPAPLQPRGMATLNTEDVSVQLKTASLVTVHHVPDSSMIRQGIFLI